MQNPEVKGDFLYSLIPHRPLSLVLILFSFYGFTESAEQVQEKVKVCPFFLRQKCHFGNRCRLSHRSVYSPGSHTLTDSVTEHFKCFRYIVDKCLIPF